MQRTFFYLPHEIFGVSLFGVGWILLIWLVVNAWILYSSVRRRGWNAETFGQLPLTVIVALAIIFVIPRIEQPIVDPAWILPPVPADTGLPIRGYGVMLLVSVVMGVTMSYQRAARAGLAPDHILNLSFVFVICGIVGARLFFILQYWPTLRADTLRETIGNLLSIDKGGLVVYGSLIGASVGFVVFAVRNRIPILPLADLIAPALAFGMVFGRIGCLMNGCCYGGACDQPWAVTFPAGSPPYLDQQSLGTFFGFQIGADDQGRPVVTQVDPDGPFAELPVGATITEIDGRSVQSIDHARYWLEVAATELRVRTAAGQASTGRIDQLPNRSLPVHPTQIYSSINALLLCGLLLLVYPYRRKHGQVIALGLTVYAVTRFLLELIRTDEGAFLAQLTISQNVSIAICISMVALWIYVQRQQPIQAHMPVR